MHPDLAKLLDLQARDSVLLDIDARRQTLLDDVERLDAELTRARSEVEGARRALEAGIRRRDEVEAKVESLRVLQERRRQRLEMAKTTRELQALGSELELARSILAREEAEWFRASEALSTLENDVAAAVGRLEGLEAEQTARREELGSRIAEVEEERATAFGAREESARTLGRPLLLRYDRLRQSRAAQVVVPIRNDACGACFTAIPMSRRSQIRTGFLLEGCEACGVILYAAVENE
jgi:predicted  nucleic acid-binding Zn-ribbon protein